MYSLIEDLSQITTIPVVNFNQITKKSKYCICDCIQSEILDGNDCVDIQIGIGTLSIKVTDSEIQYRFVPTEDFEEDIKTVVLDHKNPLQQLAEKKLSSRILKCYKDYI